jgi:Leucine-rich repeat (LRR) protein
MTELPFASIDRFRPVSDSTNAAKPKRKRRWFQYSLRTFLLLITIFAIWFGWLTNNARNQREAVSWVRANSGVVWYDYENNKPPGPTWLQQTIGIDFSANVVAVHIETAQITNLTPLAELESLKRIAVIEAAVSDLTPLANLKQLAILELPRTQVSDLTHLAALESLEFLDLSYTPVSDLSPLLRLKNLQYLKVRGTLVDQEQVAKLRRALPHCDILTDSDSYY